jgi:hypothetical protein
MSEQRQRRFEDQPSGDPESVIALADDHPAILCNTTVFGSTIVSAGDSQGLLISGANNRKIGKVVTKGAWKGMAIYTLTLTERMTCPASCHMIRECYGNSMPFARRHLPGEDFERRIRAEVVEKARLHRGGFVVRLHVLGDFYSAGYVRVWRDLLNTVPELHLFGYTATGTSALPSDVEIVSEIEGLNEDYPDQCFIRFSDPETIPGGAVVISRHPEAAIVPEGTVCPAEREATACCATCALCWEKPARGKAIVFVKHGLGASTTASAAKMASKTDANNMRSVAPIKAAAQLAGKIRNKPPILLWVRPIELYVDETYQRNLSKKSIRLITKIVQEWDWTHMKPPIAVKDAATGRLFLLDGQHTAIAAASHPDVEQIPVMIVEAESELSSRARAFIGHNRDRINVTPLQLHHSGVVAEDAQAAGDRRRMPRSRCHRYLGTRPRMAGSGMARRSLSVASGRSFGSMARSRPRRSCNVS